MYLFIPVVKKYSNFEWRKVDKRKYLLLMQEVGRFLPFDFSYFSALLNHGMCKSKRSYWHTNSAGLERCLYIAYILKKPKAIRLNRDSCKS